MKGGEGKRTPETNYFHHDEDVLPVVDPNVMASLKRLCVTKVQLLIFKMMCCRMGNLWGY